MFLKPIGHKNDGLQYQEGVYRLCFSDSKYTCYMPISDAC